MKNKKVRKEVKQTSSLQKKKTKVTWYCSEEEQEKMKHWG